MLIQCPTCGERDLSEFSYVGDATVKRPKPPEARPEEWQSFVYLRQNPRGPHSELWQHNGGCRLILEVTRNTLTHEILGTRVAGPQRAGSGT
ncbi:MAG: sarcosine oxidase subunit delta [Hyphomicrobiales bacterium]